MSEPQAIKSNKDRFLSRLKERNAGKEFADEEAYFGQISDDYDDYDQIKSRENELIELFTRDPRSTAFLMEWKKGGDPITALISHLGPKLKEALEDPSRLEQIKSANKEYAERVAESAKYDQEYDRNIEETKSVLDNLQEQNGWTDDQVDSIMIFLIGVMKDAILGKFTKETIMMASKAINHDADVEEAAHEAEIRGRNAKIDTKLRKSKESDGLPQMGGKNQNSAPSKRRQSIFDVAKGAM